jgi:hypothetical protein
VTVCHYPTGCSNWNPIEHRLFSQISSNWAGGPLRTWDTVIAFIRGTQTVTGLVVQACDYPTGQKVSDAEMAALHIGETPGTYSLTNLKFVPMVDLYFTSLIQSLMELTTPGARPGDVLSSASSPVWLTRRPCPLSTS